MSLDPQYIIPYLKQIPLFASLNDDECLDIVRTFGMENKRQGELLCMEGAVSEDCEQLPVLAPVGIAA